MTTATFLPQATDLSAENYLVVGVAICYVRADGETHEVQVLAPIPSAYLEAVLSQVPTSYKQLQGVTLGQVVANNHPQPLPGLSNTVQFGENFVDRAIAAARTYQSHANQPIPVNTTKVDINHSTQKKRILNSKHVVTADDNVKQHKYTHQVL